MHARNHNDIFHPNQACIYAIIILEHLLPKLDDIYVNLLALIPPYNLLLLLLVATLCKFVHLHVCVQVGIHSKGRPHDTLFTKHFA